MVKSKTINVQGTIIKISSSNISDYICITDMANAKEGEARAADIIKNWIRTRNTLEFLGTWEQLYNPDFKVVEFDHFKIFNLGLAITQNSSFGDKSISPISKNLNAYPILYQ